MSSKVKCRKKRSLKCREACINATLLENVRVSRVSRFWKFFSVRNTSRNSYELVQIVCSKYCREIATRSRKVCFLAYEKKRGIEKKKFRLMEIHEGNDFNWSRWFQIKFHDILLITCDCVLLAAYREGKKESITYKYCDITISISRILPIIYENRGFSNKIHFSKRSEISVNQCKSHFMEITRYIHNFYIFHIFIFTYYS